MKKTILTLIAAAFTMPILAQYNGAGFYRIKNHGSANRYISIANNKVEESAKNAEPQAGMAQEISIWSLRTIKEPISDPGSILYISGNTNDLSIEAQGMRTKDLIGQYKLQASGSTLWSEAKGVQVYMVDNYEVGTKEDAEVRIVTNKIRSQAGSYATWEMIRIDNQNEYFGVRPEIKVGDKYYTTLYAFFAYELAPGMKAYYVDQHLDESLYKYADVPVAELIEISGQVPAGIPVILECSSQKPADNILKPLTSSSTKIDNSKNELSGNRFCFYSLFAGKEKTSTEYWNELRNVVEYESSMRVLGVDKNGKLALVPAAKDQLEWTDKTTKGYLPANIAYFTKTTGLGASASLQLVDQEGFKAAKEAAEAAKEAAEGSSKQETMFNEQKDVKKKECEDMAMDGDDEYCSELINKAKKDIDDLQFNKDKSLDDNLEAIDAIAKQLAIDLSIYRASSIENITKFTEQKDIKKKECDDMAMVGDDDYCRELIDKAKKDIDGLQFNKDKSLDDNLAAIDAITKQLATDLSTYRASGIESMRHSETADNVWYDLQGRRLQDSPKQKGVYINRGRKVINK